MKVGSDYLLSNFGEQTIIPKPTEIVFVGYGIIAPEFDHNDYMEKKMLKVKNSFNVKWRTYF
ncbi:MAG: hypothetical protein H6613_01680 [Ignavibacteriales bacterium]|nr:hypothetical protein [Ignavibacteriales bacterium]